MNKYLKKLQSVVIIEEMIFSKRKFYLPHSGTYPWTLKSFEIFNFVFVRFVDKKIFYISLKLEQCWCMKDESLRKLQLE